MKHGANKVLKPYNSLKIDSLLEGRFRINLPFLFRIRFIKLTSCFLFLIHLNNARKLISIENKETLKIKIYNNDLTYMYYDINSGNNIKNDFYKVYPIETTSKAIIVNEELGYRLIDMDTKEPLSSNYSYMGFDLVKERFNLEEKTHKAFKYSDRL